MEDKQKELLEDLRTFWVCFRNYCRIEPGFQIRDSEWESYKALLRLVDDMERLKKEAGWILEDCQQRGDGAFCRCRKYIEELRDYKYGGEGKE